MAAKGDGDHFTEEGIGGTVPIFDQNVPFEVPSWVFTLIG
jgi:hypothetical protein